MNDISLRDWFAGQALIGLATSENLECYSYSQLAAWAYAFADAMMDAR